MRFTFEQTIIQRMMIMYEDLNHYPNEGRPTVHCCLEEWEEIEEYLERNVRDKELITLQMRSGDSRTFIFKKEF